VSVRAALTIILCFVASSIFLSVGSYFEGKRAADKWYATHRQCMELNWSSATDNHIISQYVMVPCTGDPK
jgi:hypothetical protein